METAAADIMPGVGSSLIPSHPDWGPQPMISDGDLTLRPFHPGDAWSMRAWNQHPQTRRLFEFPPLPPSDEHLRRIWWVIGEFRRGYERGERIPFVVTDASSGDVLGSVELHDVRGARPRSRTRQSLVAEERGSQLFSSSAGRPQLDSVSQR
jgi:hypothetical protein